jgi:hypothetical protein
MDSTLTIPRTAEPDFDEETHCFRVDGRVIPSVTGILRAAGIGHSDTTESGFTISEEVMEIARERGSNVHLACEYLDRGGVDCDWDDGEEPDWWPYALAYEQFKEDTGFVPDLIEHRVYCAEHDYCGILDRAGWIENERVVLDLKSGGGGLKPWHPVQLAAYAYPIGGDEWPLRMVVELKPDLKRKQYKVHRFSPQSAGWDMEVFLAARTILTFKELSCKAR